MKFSKYFDLILKLGQLFPHGWVFGERNILKKESAEESIIHVGIPKGEQTISNDQEFEDFIKRSLRSVDYSVNSPIRFSGYKLKPKHIGKRTEKKYFVNCVISPC